MAYFKGDIRSGVLGMDTGLCVLLPYDRPAEDTRRPCKVLYLLHGLGNNSTAWTRFSQVERYAQEAGLAVIMPEVQRSFYLDMEMGENYFTYVTEELPQLCRQLFHISGEREDTFVAGLSMGGYGALKCAFSRPDQYAACASFSGAVDVKRALTEFSTEEERTAFQAGLGLGLPITDSIDLFALSRELPRLSPSQRPRIYITCGEQDFLHPMNQAFQKHLTELALDVTYQEWPGSHEWSFWDTSIQRAIPFFLGHTNV